MARIRIEFTVEPFAEGAPGPHVLAAVDAIEAAGLHPEVGPFATAVEGEPADVAGAVGPLLVAAFDHGATGVSLSAREIVELAPATREFLDAMRPVAQAMGATLVPAERLRPTDVPLHWRGRTVGGLRPPDRPEPADDLQGALARLIAQVERELGGRLAELSREGKQQAALLLEQRGAFHLRNSIDEVADALGVSRVTVYNYLNAIRNQAVTG